MIDRGGKGSKVGEQLLEHENVLMCGDGGCAKGNGVTAMATTDEWLRLSLHQRLTEKRCCAEFTDTPVQEKSEKENAIEPRRMRGITETDHATERTLRHPVQWRKTSYGTASERGSVGGGLDSY